MAILAVAIKYSTILVKATGFGEVFLECSNLYARVSLNAIETTSTAVSLKIYLAKVCFAKHWSKIEALRERPV